MTKPKALILTGYGINCEEETAYAFTRAGAKSKIIHINDAIENKNHLRESQILAFPGGFSYGDDTGSGNAYANRVRNHLTDELKEFLGREGLVIGICNGFQILTNLGLLPAFDGTYGERRVALLHNNQARYLDRWVDVKFEGKSYWTNGLERMSLPIAHGEGKFYADEETLKELNKRRMVSLRYIKGEMCNYQNLVHNPNGAIEDIAGITDESGRVLGLMPHPERAMDFTQLPNWPLKKELLKRAGQEIPTEADGIKIFKNGVNYFK